MQAVFRFFKAHMADLPQKEVQAVLVTALGMDLVRTAWAEARKEMEEHVQADLARMLRPYTCPGGPNSAAAAAAEGGQGKEEEEEKDRSTRAREEEEARRVRPRMGLVRQGTLFWRAGDAMPSAQTGDDGSSVVLTMARLSPATEADQDAMPRPEEEKAGVASAGGAAVVDAMEDEEFLLEGAPEALLWYVFLYISHAPVTYSHLLSLPTQQPHFLAAPRRPGGGGGRLCLQPLGVGDVDCAQPPRSHTAAQPHDQRAHVRHVHAVVHLAHPGA